MINTQCPSDEELVPILAGETANPDLASHLQDCSACRRRVDLYQSDLAALRAVDLSTPLPQADRESAPRPALIGKYLVVGLIDSGGQADVYRAVHPTLDHELAIKLSRRPVGKLSDHRALLVAEGRLLARLDHPNLARIYDLDFHDDRPFLVMEYVRGQNLRKLAANGPIPPRQAAELVAGIARALAEVHRHGVVHQDVKPHNVLVDPDGRPRLIDFGLARLRHAWDAGGGHIGGTPAFIPPEQARGETGAVGPRSDVFGAGAVLYFLLTTRAPFQEDSITAALTLAASGTFDRSALARPGIPRHLRTICLKAMATNPADRYATAADLAAALESYLRKPRRIARMVGGLAAVAVVGVALIFLAGPPQRGTNEIASVQSRTEPLELLVARGTNSYPLGDALPLNPQMDRMQVIARVPPGHHAAMLHVNGRGVVKVLPVEQSPADGFTRLVFPGGGNLVGLEPGVPGTEVVFVVAAESASALDGIEDLTGSILAGLPPLPTEAVIRLNKDQADRDHSPTFGEATPDPITTVENRLDRLRIRLRDRPLSVVAGIAYGRR